MRKFTSLILCLCLIFTMGMFLGCKKKEPVPEEGVTSWMATETENQYEQVGEDQEEYLPLLEEGEESYEEYEEEGEASSDEEEHEWD